MHLASHRCACNHLRALCFKILLSSSKNCYRL